MQAIHAVGAAGGVACAGAEQWRVRCGARRARALHERELRDASRAAPHTLQRTSSLRSHHQSLTDTFRSH